MFYRGSETVTIKREVFSGELDDYGNPIESTPTTITVKNVFVAFGTTDEPIDVARDAVDIQITLYMPRNTVILDGDVFTIRGTDFVKDGSPADWKSPSNLHSVVIPVRKRHG